MTIKIYHNPRCSKSRETLKLIEEQQPEVVKYLEQPLTLAELTALAAKLDQPVSAMIRPKETEFKESGLSLDSSDEQLLAFIAEHPRVMERPIVETDTSARIGRPPEQVLELFS